MQIVSVTSQKGGVGKTTLAMNIAVAATVEKISTIVFDLDGQGSASGYYRRRKENNYPHAPEVKGMTSMELPAALRAAKDDGYGLVIIDTPPNVSADSVHISQAGDVILIPVQPSALDIDAIQISIEIVKRSGRPGAVVMNRCKSQGTFVEESIAVVEEHFGFPVLKQTVGERVAFQYGALSGLGVVESEPNSKASEEIKAIWKDVKGMLRQVRVESKKLQAQG